jgi:2,5-diketo-D-gluconate reductase A
MQLSSLSTVKLSHGTLMPYVGIGTYLCSNEEARLSVEAALKCGYRHIDTAELYANHEGIAAAIKVSGISRTNLFITDKLNPGGKLGAPQKTYEDTIQTVKSHLEKLNTDYVDLYLIHHALAKDQRLNQYRAIVDLQKQGLIREVGVSNWNIAHLEELRAAGLPTPAVNQIEIHPLCCQWPLVTYLREHGILPQAYSSLVPLSNWRTAPGQGSSKIPHTTVSPASEALIASLAAKYDISQAQLLLRWGIQHGYPVLPKSVKQDRVTENIQLFYFKLEDNDMAALDALNQDASVAWRSGNPLHVP